MGKLNTRQYRRLLWCMIGAAFYGVVQSLLYTAARALLKGIPGISEGGVQLLNGLTNAVSLGLPVIMLLTFSPLRGKALRCATPTRWRLGFYLPIYLGLSILFNLLAILAQPLDNDSVRSLPTGFFAVLAVIAANCLIPAVLEELLFRGALMGLLLPLGSGIAIFCPALLFAAFHSQPSQMVVALLTGLYFGWVAQRTGSILPGMVLHFTNNLVAILEMYLDEYVGDPIAGGIELFYLLFIGLIALAILIACVHQRRIPSGNDMEPGPGLSALFSQPLFLLYTAILAAVHIFL